MGIEARYQVDVLAQQAPQHLLEIAGERVQVEDVRLQHLSPAEGEELPCQARGAIGGIEYLLNIRRVGAFTRQVGHHHRAVARDDGEKVVEVVGDATGELANGFHLLRLLQLRLESATLRRFSDEHADRHRRSFGDDDGEEARPQLPLRTSAPLRRA